MANFFYYYPEAIYNNQVVTDLLVRAKVRETWLNDPRLYYNYKYKDGDRPEHLAQKYYGNEELHWIILFTNNIFDSNWDFPMDYWTFNKYIEDKYKDQGAVENKTGMAYAQTTPDPIYRYQKTVKITTPDGVTTKDYVIDKKSYNELVMKETYSTGTPYSAYVNATINSDELTLVTGNIRNVGDIVLGNEFIPNFTTIENIDSGNNKVKISSTAKMNKMNGEILLYDTGTNYSLYEVYKKYPEISIYEQELSVNESKRNVKILNKTYVRKAQEEFQRLIRQY